MSIAKSAESCSLRVLQKQNERDFTRRFGILKRNARSANRLNDEKERRTTSLIFQNIYIYFYCIRQSLE